MHAKKVCDVKLGIDQCPLTSSVMTLRISNFRLLEKIQMLQKQFSCFWNNICAKIVLWVTYTLKLMFWPILFKNTIPTQLQPCISYHMKFIVHRKEIEWKLQLKFSLAKE